VRCLICTSLLPDPFTPGRLHPYWRTSWGWPAPPPCAATASS